MKNGPHEFPFFVSFVLPPGTNFRTLKSFHFIRYFSNDYDLLKDRDGVMWICGIRWIQNQVQFDELERKRESRRTNKSPSKS